MRAQHALKSGEVDDALKQTVQALASTPQSEMTEHLDRLRPDNGEAWMRTFLTLGALDLVGALEEANKETARVFPHDSSHHALKACDEWATVAMAFLGAMGSGTVNRKEVPPVTWPMPPGVVTAFEEGTRHLVRQADALRSMTNLEGPAAWPRVDSLAAQKHKAVAAMSMWASMACFLNRPDLLKSIVDAYPETMSTATPMGAWRNLGSLKVLNGHEAFATTSVSLQFVSPLLCAIHASSPACMDVLMAKRRALGLGIDPPIFSYEGPRSDWKTLTQKVVEIDKAATPDMVMHVLQPVMAQVGATRQVAWDMIQKAQSQPALFIDMAEAGVFHGHGDSLPVQALQAAINWVPAAMPTLLKRIDWTHLRDVLASETSPFLISLQGANLMDIKEQRQTSLLALVAHAKAEGYVDLLLRNFPRKDDKAKALVQSPIAQISAAGFDRVVVAFMDNGFDPKAKPDGVELSLIELATRNQHPTLSTIHSHQARGRAHQLLDDIDNATFKVRP